MRKILLGMLAWLSMSASVNAADKMIMPDFLQPGDTIAIISPASIPDRGDVEGACRVFEEWGYVPVLGKYVFARHGSFAGTIEQRLSDLKWAFETPGIKAVMCSRGGYGSIQELVELKPGFFADHPKWLIGYSDISAIHAAMVTDGVMSIHGNMCGPLNKSNGNDPRSEALRSLLAGELPYYEIESHALNRSGKVSGKLIGGNMAVLMDLASSDIDVLVNEDQYILFVEDIDESLQSLNRMIYRLKAAGVLDSIGGLIVGRFNNAPANQDFRDINELFHSVVKDYDFPVCYDFPTGHVKENYPLIEGATVTLTVGGENTTLEFHNPED